MRIFISYRRHSSSDITARIYDRLGARFGASHVFHDVSNVEIGEDFKARLMGELARADAVVAVIGPDWLQGGLLLDEDYVRLEIQTALQWGIPIVPVLVAQAHMPPPSSLPEPLSRLSRMSATEVRSGRDFDSDTHLLIKALEAVPPRPGRRRRLNFAVLLTSGLAAAALATGAIAWSRSHSVSRTTESPHEESLSAVVNGRAREIRGPWSQATRVVNDELSSASQPVLGMTPSNISCLPAASSPVAAGDPRRASASSTRWTSRAPPWPRALIGLRWRSCIPAGAMGMKAPRNIG